MNREGSVPSVVSKAEGHGRTALVTGASSGIGAAFADVLAARGYTLVLTARRADRLAAARDRLSSAYGVPVHVIAGDLADVATPGRLVDEAERRGLAVDVLVNNAGYGVPGGYQTTPWQDQAALLQVLVTTPAELTHRLLPGMLDRRWGRIVNVASLAGLLPAVAGHTLYAAAKAFLVKATEALAPEVRHAGVHVTALCPGMTRTEFHDVTDMRAAVNRLPPILWMDAARVAHEGWAAAMRGDTIYVPGRTNRALALGARLLPRRAALFLVGRHADKFRRVTPQVSEF